MNAISVALFWLAPTLLLSGCDHSAADIQKPLSVPYSIHAIRIRPADATSTSGHHLLTVADPVIVTVETRGGGVPTQVSARFIFLGNGTEVSHAQAELSAKQDSVRLRFVPTPGWRPGRYLVEVKLAGKFAGKQYVDLASDAPASTASSSPR